MNNIYFVAGIHGVGKTTFCKMISQKYCIEHYSASELIIEAKKQPFTTLFIEDIDKNQILLINAINKLLNNNNLYLLDGHFCLLNEFKLVERINQKTFELLGIKAIFVLVDDVNTIFARLKNRTGIEYSLDMINKLQEEELDYSREISLYLNVPHFVFNISKMKEEQVLRQLNLILNKNKID